MTATHHLTALLAVGVARLVAFKPYSQLIPQTRHPSSLSSDDRLTSTQPAGMRKKRSLPDGVISETAKAGFASRVAGVIEVERQFENMPAGTVGSAPEGRFLTDPISGRDTKRTDRRAPPLSIGRTPTCKAFPSSGLFPRNVA